MKRKKILLLILFPIYCFSQNPSEENLGSWYVLYAKLMMTKKISTTLGFEERNYQTIRNYNLILYQGAINYQLTKKLSATAGYMYLDIDRSFDPDQDPNTIENRFYQQLLLKATYFKLPFTHRLRFENRHLNSPNNKIVRNRIRYRIKTKKSIASKLYASFSSEFFSNINGNFYAENRLILSLGYPIFKGLKLEAGYLYQYINHLHLDRIHVGLYLNFDLRKKTP